jgi:hypothetical protein
MQPTTTRISSLSVTEVLLSLKRATLLQTEGRVFPTPEPSSSNSVYLGSRIEGLF